MLQVNHRVSVYVHMGCMPVRHGMSNKQNNLDMLCLTVILLVVDCADTTRQDNIMQANIAVATATSLSKL